MPNLELAGGTWILATISAALVGLSGLFPVFLLSREKTSDTTLRFMLSFACGGLLGDVFLHLLPEAHLRIKLLSSGHAQDHSEHLGLGLWILFGILAFIVIEIMCKSGEESDESKDTEGKIAVSGYLNLIANCIDNFAHGLAVGGAFLVDNKTGIVTTSCILFHEIPHEIGDFAILMKSGFNKMDAAKAQLYTASLGIIGALAALALNSLDVIDNATAWIIPFTSGGFIQISLVTVLPDLLVVPKGHSSASDLMRVLSGITLGVSVMLLISKL